MRKIFALSVLIFPVLSFAQQNDCDEYYQSAFKYFDVMSTYDNDKGQIELLRSSFKNSEEKVRKVKGDDKHGICKEMNLQIENLISKFSKNKNNN